MSCGVEVDRWKVDIVGKFFGVDAGHDGDDEGGVGKEKRTNHNTVGQVDEESFLVEAPKGPSKEEGMPVTFKEDSNNNKCFHVPNYQAYDAAEEIVDLVLNLALNPEKDDLTEPIDATNVAFACQDVRLKPGFVMPVKVKKPKIVVEKKVVVDTFYDYLASPGECVIIPDVAEETWMDATDKELGQELADKLKEDKVDVIVSLVEKFGRNIVLDFFWETQKIEESGGLMIMNGARRRSSGGVLFHLLRGTKDEKIREKVDEFFEERQNNDCRRKKAVSDLKKKKLEKGVKEFKEERSINVKDKKRNVAQQEEVIDISALFE